jgi:hypothetical protein
MVKLGMLLKAFLYAVNIQNVLDHIVTKRNHVINLS